MSADATAPPRLRFCICRRNHALLTIEHSAAESRPSGQIVRSQNQRRLPFAKFFFGVAAIEFRTSRTVNVGTVVVKCFKRAFEIADLARIKACQSFVGNKYAHRTDGQRAFNFHPKTNSPSIGI